MNYLREGFYRPSLMPAENIPLGARSVGHYIVDRSFAEAPAMKNFLQIFWCITGTGRFIFDGVEKKLNPEEIAVYFPGSVHELVPETDKWEYRWWTMDGPLSVNIASCFGIDHSGIYKAGKAPVEIFSELANAISTNTPFSQRNASGIAYRLLCCASDSSLREDESDSIIKDTLEMINKNWRNPQLSVESVADAFGLDRTIFSKRFHAEIGVSPVKYISSLRVQNALSELKNSRENIYVTAKKCGWNDANYFARCIKKAIGCSPEDFRKS